MPKDLAIAREFKRRAVEAMPHRVAKVVLHGSRARGDSRPGSEWDIAVFIKGRPTAHDRSVLSHISYDLMMETGAHLQALPFPSAHERLNYRFYRNVRTDGVVI